jgi:hypothetical protein
MGRLMSYRLCRIDEELQKGCFTANLAEMYQQCTLADKSLSLRL